MAKLVEAQLIKKEQLLPDIYRFTIDSFDIATNAKPGQFLEIRVTEGTEPFLRRPISIHQVNPEQNTVSFIFQVKGKGTVLLAKKKEGDIIDILGPLGYGTFQIQEKEKVAILGGGIGVFPLYDLAKQLQQKGNIVDIYLGYRSKEQVVLENEFQKVASNLVITTDDGSYGTKGLAIACLKQHIHDYTMIYGCGPLPMLQALQKTTKEEGIPCQISLEERMGCGIGACLGCAVKIVSGKQERYGHVCKEGPVFFANDVEI